MKAFICNFILAYRAAVKMSNHDAFYVLFSRTRDGKYEVTEIAGVSSFDRRL